MTERGRFLVSEGAQVVTVTLPPEAVCHYITDAELDGLGEMKKEPVMEICLCAIGAFLGSLVPAIQQLGKLGDRANPLDGVGFATLVVAVSALAIAAVTGWLSYRRRGTHRDLVTTIRARPKMPVSLVHDQSA